MDGPKYFSRHIAKLEAPTYKDLDPEEDHPIQDGADGSGSEESDNELAGTEHYLHVGKSKLRRPAEVALGPAYKGSKISREALLDSDSKSASEGEEDSVDGDGVVYGFGTGMVDERTMAVDAKIHSVIASGASDGEKDSRSTFARRNQHEGNIKPAKRNGTNGRLKASDFMSDKKELEVSGSVDDGPIDDEDLDVYGSHDDGSEFSFAKFEGETIDGQVDVSEESEPSREHNADETSDSDEDDVNASESQGDSLAPDEDEVDEQARRAELRKIMGEEQESVVATISKAAKADVDKGNAVKQQRKTFDAVLNVRMQLQKALIASNSIAAILKQDVEEAQDNKPYQAAEDAAIKLWNTLDSVRHDLSVTSSLEMRTQKRKRDIDISTASSEIWQRMQDHEAFSVSTRQAVIEKWSCKVKASKAQPISRNLKPGASQQTLTSFLEDHLSNSNHLLQRTRIPRSCAPIQAASKIGSDSAIYDDADWYQLLLQELIAQKKGTKYIDFSLVREAKTRKIVDTKASKGRKLRYNVHEKLQNFMASEDRRAWEDSAIARFFGSLLGQGNVLNEGVGKTDEDEEMVDRDIEEEGLRLFRS